MTVPRAESLSLSHRVIYNPFLDQLYHGIRGQGSFLNHTIRLPLSSPLAPLPLASLGEALLAVEWGSDRSKEVRAHIAPVRIRLNYEQLIRSSTRRLCRSRSLLLMEGILQADVWRILCDQWGKSSSLFGVTDS